MTKEKNMFVFASRFEGNYGDDHKKIIEKKAFQNILEPNHCKAITITVRSFATINPLPKVYTNGTSAAGTFGEKQNASTKMEKTLKNLLVVHPQSPYADSISGEKESTFMNAFGINFQLGHERRYRHPAMTGFLYGQRKGVGDFFDLRVFSRHLKQAYRFVEEIAKGATEDTSGRALGEKSAAGKLVIFVAKDKSHYKLLKPLFASLRDVFQNEDLKKTRKATPLLLEKWTPGLLTQGRLLDTPLGHPIVGAKKNTKSITSRMEGTSGVPEAVPALIITFGNKLIQQIKREAIITKTPLIAVVDSDQDPRGISFGSNYVIPCNDDNYKGQYFLGRVLLDPFFSCFENFGTKNRLCIQGRVFIICKVPPLSPEVPPGCYATPVTRVKEAASNKTGE